MAATDGSDLDIRLRLRDAPKFQRDAKRSGKSVRDFGKDADGAGRRAKMASTAFGGMRSGLMGVGSAARATAIAVGVTAGVLGVKAVKAAVDLGEQTNKANVIFKSSTKDILAWSQTTDTALGLSAREALASAAQFGGLFNQMNFGEKKSAKMSKQMVGLSGDLASMFNSSPQEALEALQSAFAGETEPLRKYNVFITEAAIAQEAASLGLKKHKGALTEAQKTQARYSLILKSTKVAQGDFGRTSDSLANQQRILSGQLDNLAARVGTIFIPALTKGAKFLTGTLLPAFQDVGKDMEVIFGRKDIDLGEKLKLTGKSFNKHVGPFMDEVAARFRAADVQTKLDSGVAWIAPKIGQAFAKAAPKALSAFWNAFKASGTTGQGITVGLLAAKLGLAGPMIAGVGGLLAAGVRKGWGKSFGKKKLPIPGLGGSAAGLINITAASVVVNGGTGATIPGDGPKKGPLAKLKGAVKNAASAAGGAILGGGRGVVGGARAIGPKGLLKGGAGVGAVLAANDAGNALLDNTFGKLPSSAPSNNPITAFLDSLHHSASGKGTGARSNINPFNPAMVGAAFGRDVVVHNHIELDGRQIAESVARQSSNKRARK